MKYVIWSMAFLLVCTVTDLKERKVYTLFCLGNLAAVIALMLWNNEKFINIMLGMVPGIILLGISLIASEAIGRGDAIVVMVIGSALGYTRTVEILTWAFLTCLVVAGIGKLKKKITLKSKMPFVPFLMTGECITVIMSFL